MTAGFFSDIFGNRQKIFLEFLGIMLSTREQVEEQIKKAEDILIAAPRDKNGDCLAGALALFLFLRRMEKNVDIVIENLEEKKSLSFLPGFGEIMDSPAAIQKLIVSLDISQTKVGEVKYLLEDNRLDFIITPKDGQFTGNEVAACNCAYKYDLIITVGAPDLESLGAIQEKNPGLFYGLPIINIDNDPGNGSYGQINLIELTAVSIAQIIFPLFKSLNQKFINEDIATCLLAGIISKTRNFRSRTISPQVLEAASDLIALGGKKEEIINKLFRSRTFNVLKLWGRVLARLQSAINDQLIWSILNQADFEKTGAGESDLIEAIDELIVNVPTAKVIVLIFEDKNNKTKAWVYAAGSLDALGLAADFRPAGTKNLVKFELDQPLVTGEKAIISRLEEKIKKILEKE